MARGRLSKVNDWLWRTTNRREVMKDLADTRGDWLRTTAGLRTVIGLGFFVLFPGRFIVWFVDDGIGVTPLILVAGIFGAWFLLRRALRFVADAPDDALDERLIAIRNQIYPSAFRALATVVGLGISFLIWAFGADDGGVITTTLTMTLPQANAVVWFLYGQVLLWPSLALALAINRREVHL